jgi:hypothetical protein
MWDKLKAICGRSLTIAWGYALAIFGSGMLCLDGLSLALGDASFNQQIQTVLGASPSVMAKWSYFAAAITIIARLRGIVASKP